jgi:leucyl aminopeptidase
MKLSFSRSAIEAIPADAHAVCVYSDKNALRSEAVRLEKTFGLAASLPLSTGDFRAKQGELSVVYLGRKGRLRRLVLAGLGPKDRATLETFRRTSGSIVKKARSLNAGILAVELPHMEPGQREGAIAFGEAAILSHYRFDKYKSRSRENNERSVRRVVFCRKDSSLASGGSSAIREAAILATSTVLARDLANAPGNEMYPESLARAVKHSAHRAGYRVTVLDRKKLARLSMGGVLGVSQGSDREPRFLVLEYGNRGKKPVVLVGKGVTFDTGGISIKPSSGMSEMKMDMSGAAAVVGTFEAVARLKLPVHLVGLIPAVENMPGGNALRPGDVIRHHNGKTSEVEDTDAEGRLILADALAYASRYSPSAVVALATLTGACVVALGHHASGMMGNDDMLMAALKGAGEKTYERVWQLPLYEEFERQIKSDIADVKNLGGRWGGAITAALFLKRFIGNYRWAHLDIAGPAMRPEPADYIPKGASGVDLAFPCVCSYVFFGFGSTFLLGGL